MDGSKLWFGRRGKVSATAAFALVALGGYAVVACYADPAADPATGTPPFTTNLDVSFATEPNGPPNFLGASGLNVEGGAMTLSPGATQGATGLPFSLAGGNSKVTITASVPPGATLIVGRGRIRGSTSQAALATVFTPPEVVQVPARASAFLVALGIGTFGDPLTQKAADLGCGGATGQTFVQMKVAGVRIASPSFVVEGGEQPLFLAPQLANLSDVTNAGAYSNVPYAASETETTDYVVDFKKTAEGEGTMASSVGGVDLLPEPYAVSRAKTAGTSMGCKLSFLACAEACERGLGPIVFKQACTAVDCGTPLGTNQDKPQPIDFQDTESCRQTALNADSCNAALRPEAPTAVTYRVATNEVFGAAPNGNQFFLQLVRSTLGVAPRVTRIVITP